MNMWALAILGAIFSFACTQPVKVAGTPERLAAVEPPPAPAETTSPALGTNPTQVFVSPTGRDDNAGDSPRRPLATIQAALDKAQPGTTVTLAEGVYDQDFRSRRAGEANRPIEIAGPRNAVVRGSGQDHVAEINHDYHVLRGFTIDGLFGSGDSRDDYRSKLIWIQGSRPPDGGTSVTGVRLLDLSISNALGECVRLRYFAVANEIAGNSISNCGLEDFRFDGGGKNGEGIYIGTAPEQLADGKNASAQPDRSDRNIIRNNVIHTQGNECVDIKEAASANLVEQNACTGQLDPESAGFDSRGNANIFRANSVVGSVGAGIRLGGDGPGDGLDNDVYDNILMDNAGGGVKFMRRPQGLVCGNRISGGSGRAATGAQGGGFRPAHACPRAP